MTQAKGNKHFLVAIDGSAASWAAWDSMMYLIRPTDKITTITVIDREKSAKYTDKDHKYHEEKIQSELKEADIPGFPSESLEIIVQYKKGQDTKTIVIEKATAKKVDFLVTGVRGRKNYSDEAQAQKILGHTTDFSLRQWKGSSIIAEKDFIKPKPGEAVWVVGVDGSENSKKGYKTARSLMRKGDHLYVLHIKAITEDESNRPKQFRSSEIAEHYTKMLENDPEAEFKLVEAGGDVPEAINGFIEKVKAHYLCIGADGMKAFINGSSIMGSVSDRCVRLTKECTCIVSQLNTVE